MAAHVAGWLTYHHINRKKAEQAGAREEIKQERKAGVDVDGGAGERAAGTEDNTCV